MRSLRSILITGAFPDRLNLNVGIRSAIAEGFRNALPAAEAVRETRFEEAAADVLQNRPELVLLVGSCYPDSVRYEMLREACDRTDALLVFWLHDDPYEFDAHYRACEAADVIFTSDRWASRHYPHPRVHHLPLAGCPAVFLRPTNQRRYVDLFFCGVAFPNRIALLRDLAPRLTSRNAAVFGDGWPDDLRDAMAGCRNQRLSPAQFADYCAASLLTLNVGRHYDLANRRFQLPASTPGPRTFEAAMAGAVQLAFVEGLEITDYFEPDEEILLLDHPADAPRLLDELRRDPERAQRLAAAAQRRALAEHTYAHRARRLLELIND